MRGRVTAEEIFAVQKNGDDVHGDDVIISVTLDEDGPRWLCRRGGIVERPDPTRGTPLACNRRHSYWLQGGHLWRDGTLGPVQIGAVLASRTRI